MPQFRKRHDSGQAFPIGGKGVADSDFKVANMADRARTRVMNNDLMPDGTHVIHDIDLPERKGIAFVSGGVEITKDSIIVRSPHGNFRIPHKSVAISVEGTHIQPNGNITKGIPKRFVIMRYPNMIDISSTFTGLPTLKDHEFAKVL